MSLPERPDDERRAVTEAVTEANGRPAGLLARIGPDELDALAQALARVLISAAKNGYQPRRRGER